MSDLRSQLRGYVESTIRRIDPTGIEAFRAMPSHRREPLWRRRPVLVTVVAISVTLVLVGGIGLITFWLRQDTSPVVTTVPATTTTTTTTLPLTTSTTAVPGTLDPASVERWSDWTLTRPQDGAPQFPDQGHVIRDLAASDYLVVAVGDARGDTVNFQADGGIWLSSDGRTWERVSDPDELEFGGKYLTSVVAAGPGFVVGGSSCDTEERCPTKPALWTSVDGRDWTRVPDDPGLFGEQGSVSDLLVHGSNILAIGFSCVDETCANVVWASTDGVAWERLWSSESGGPEIVVSVPSGLLGIGGRAVWASADGSQWEVVADDPAVFGDEHGTAYQYDLAAGAAGFVAVGTDGIDAIVWLSGDGITWERLAHDPRVLGDASMITVIPWGSGFLAAGPMLAITEDIGGPAPGWPSTPSRPTLWVSPEGRTWHRIAFGAPDSVGTVEQLLVFRQMLLAGGQSGGFIEGEDAIWLNEQPPQP